MDGEKQLKKKISPWILSNYLKCHEDLNEVVGEVQVEKPNADLYSFVGKIMIGTDSYPLTLANFLPKGC